MEFLSGFMKTDFIVRLTDFFSDHILFNLGLLLIVGYFFGKLAQLVRLPAITGYIVAGVIMGQSFLHLVNHRMQITLNSVTEIALSLIALNIGAEFKWSKVRKVGGQILLLTVFEAVCAFILVTMVLNLAGIALQYALILGSISAATAPAATVVIIKQLRARGSFVDFLYGVVAFDDAVCVILFSVVFSVVVPMLSPQAALHSGILTGLAHAFRELFFAALIGFVSGVVISWMCRNKYRKNEILIISISVVLLCTSLNIAFNLSPLIANMVLGMTLVNLSGANARIFSIIEPITPPLFALFFILAGLELDIEVILKGSVVVFGILYIISRFLGKLSGIYLVSLLNQIPREVKKYLGLCLFPQAGVAIGLVLFIKSSPLLLSAGPEVKTGLDLILNIVLISVFINELVGPSISRAGIVRGADLRKGR